MTKKGAGILETCPHLISLFLPTMCSFFFNSYVLLFEMVGTFCTCSKIPENFLEDVVFLQLNFHEFFGIIWLAHQQCMGITLSLYSNAADIKLLHLGQSDI